MISGIGEPGDWNGHHFKSPSVIDVGDFLLVAFEGWSAPQQSSGIGLMIGVERWLQSREDVLILNEGNNYSNTLELLNQGAGNIVIDNFHLSDARIQLDIPSLPLTLKSAEEIKIPVRFISDPGVTPELIILTVGSNSIIDPEKIIYLLIY